MSIPSPILDDSSYEDLRTQLVARIPFYNPEWTDHNPSDPGITLLELFAFLGEHVLFRFNQVPEKTYLEYLNLLQLPRLPAEPARALLEFTTADTTGALIEQGAQAAAGEIRFETTTTVTVWPVSAVAVCKSPQDLPGIESDDYGYVAAAMESLGESAAGKAPIGYKNSIISASSEDSPVNLTEAVDGMLWIAVLNESELSNAELLAGLKDSGALINIGFVPDEVPPAIEDIAPCPGPGQETISGAVQWQVSTEQLIDTDTPIYRSLKVHGDTTIGLRQEGVIRMEMSVGDAGIFDFLDEDMAGAGDLPPVLDEESESRVMFWLRGFRQDQTGVGLIRHVGINSVESVQAVSARPEYLGTGNAQPDQLYRLHHAPVIADSLELEVEMPAGWQLWQEVDGFHASHPDDLHYVVDRVAGTVQLGSRKVPQIGQRIRARRYRYGGGRAGNVAAEAINKAAAVGNVKVLNPLAAKGGSDDETIEVALRRIPGEIRRRDRAVTPGDFQELALMTPGADIGRANTIELFRPKTREIQAAGVVSVVVWPNQDPRHPNAPLPTRTQLRQVCHWLDQRRLVTTEVYVIPPVYRPVAVAVGVEIKPGYAIDAVRNWVELVLRQYLAPLPPFGPEGGGWPLGREIIAAELEAAALQVEGVEFLRGLGLARYDAGTEDWINGDVTLEVDEVPELKEITVVEGPPLEPGVVIGAPPVDATPVPVPVEVDEC